MSTDDLGPYVEIPLTRGKAALVSPEDYESVSALKWSLLTPSKQRGSDYAVHYYRNADGRVEAIALHRYILNAPEGSEVDHRNGDGLDNRRANLRLATRAQNACNRRLNRNSTTGFKGVKRFGRPGQSERFRATIHSDHQGQHLGCYATAEEAAHAYDAAARELHGEFASLNFPDEVRSAT